MTSGILAAVLLASGMVPGRLSAAPQEQGPTQKDQTPETPPSVPPPSEPAVPPPPPPQEVPAAQAPETSNPALAPSLEKPKPVTPKKSKKKASHSGKVVVRNGGASDNSSQLSPGMSAEQALHQRANTSQLLATTEKNLKKVEGRQLSPTQQSMLDQIHTYVRQSQAATDAGDLPRAHTLAYKAHLLSDELARH